MPRIGLLAVAAGLALSFSPAGASAAPQVLASEPEEGAELHEAPEEVSITFDLPLDPSESDLVVIDECGRTIDDGEPMVTGNQISVGIAMTPSGRYSMVYRAVPPAGATGSSSGKIDFTVHRGPSCGPDAKVHHHGDDAGHNGHEGNDHDGAEHEAHEGTGHDGSGHDEHEGNHESAGHGGNHDRASGASHGAHRPSKNEGNGDMEPDPTVAGSALGPRTPELEPGVALAALLACALFGLIGGYFVLGARP